MRGRPGKGAGANPPKVSASPGTIKKYLTQEKGKDSPGKQPGAKSKTPEATPKIGRRNHGVVTDISIHVNDETADGSEIELRQEKQLPTKDEMMEMFARLEQSIKGEKASLHGDLSQVLKRVEESEGKLDSQAAAIVELKGQMEVM